MPQHKNALIVVAKQPAPGQTKTRLSPPLTPEHASALYECFLLDALDQMREVDKAQRVIAYLPLDARDYFHRFASDFELVPQNGHDLGSRLDHALTGCLSQGYERVVIMDSDSPTLPSAYLSQAFNALADGADVTLGPCDDGGYYLIGIKKPAPRLLREVQMSTPTVAADTIALAEKEGLRVSLLPTWYDVDDVISLRRLTEELENHTAHGAVHTRRFLQRDAIRSLLHREA
ncbi:MAG: TIGR04282 family arsenosugar biosynthesis glycosyltransferase [Anaerolineae bacterium]|nr:TIGR04282 family arsenosugar biosynthesis glycosyltransferase [Acidobacteriota bacterium]MCI0550990.1 TIGR04282 family arsenosugar biosynthesis glycosyltransferase [Anaerolineae bacterium]MCI0610163.1 TIGR04282 family arsenosugar biosynthesis glycosyltransferase [Anaerolineae bacterium]